MTEAKICDLKPCYQELKKNRLYLWCSCGLSKTQPFCDGSHAGTDFKPIRYKGQYDGEELLFCQCKQTKDGPHCDGSHANLPGGYQLDDANSADNQQIKKIGDQADVVTRLDNGCFVFRPNQATLQAEGALSWYPIITVADGAEYQAQFYLKQDEGLSPSIDFGDREVILFIAQGKGRVLISGQPFEFHEKSGVYIRPNECFQIEGEDIHCYASVCPHMDMPEFGGNGNSNFDATYPNRVAFLDHEARHAMGDRFWQLLIHRPHGAKEITQFIGHIPPSKAMPHRHLYEEALIFLSGQGVVWAEKTKTPVGPGDVLFLPRKKWHSVECTSPDGVEVVGVIYPGDNPGINY